MCKVIKVDVQDGNMIFEIPNGGDGWWTYDGKRRSTFLRLLNVSLDGWIDKDTAYARVDKLSDEELIEIGRLYQEYGREITSAAQAVIEDAKAREIERKARLEEVESKAKIVRNAVYHAENGCRLCDYHKNGFCKHANKYCLTNSYQEELAFEEYKITKKYIRPTPYPVKGCYWMDEARKITEE